MIINGGLIDTTEQAKQEYETKRELERLEMIKAQEIIEGTGKVTVDSYVDELIEQGITTEGEVTDNGDGTKTVITDEGYVVLIKPNPDNIDNDIIIEIEGKADNLPVKIEEIELTESSNSIEVKVIVKRGEGATYKYWYREGEGEYQLAHEGKETTYKIEGLKSDTRYVIKVEATNKSGTVYKEEVGYTGVITPAQGAITFGNLSWLNGKASTTVTKTTSDSYKIEYQVTNSSGTVIVAYTEIASGGTIANLNLGDLVTVRLTDGTNHGSTASLNVTDITAPSVTVAKGTVTSSIQVNVTAVDGQAGMPASPSYKYYIKKSSDVNYPTTPTSTQTSASYTFTGLEVETSYDVKVEVSDKAGNTGRGEIKGVATLDPTKDWDLSKVDKITSEDNIVVPVPKGYTASTITGEKRVDTGFVIKEGTNGGATEGINEFVWVPVPEISDIYDETHNAGQLWDFEGTTSIKQAYPTTPNSGYREPDVVTDALEGSDSASGSEYDAVLTNLQQAGFNSDLNKDGAVNAYDFKIQLQNEFNSMIESVRKYKGFYIGRYETGNLSQTEAVVQKKNRDIGSETWYTNYKLSKTIGANANVTSSMIWGCQWDATLRWMQTSEYEGVKKFPTDSTGKGNYFMPGSPTGFKAVNNIYDMAGNISDWTLEAYDTDGRAERGGDYNSLTVSGVPAGSRAGGMSPTHSYTNDYGSRATLYITP